MANKLTYRTNHYKKRTYLLSVLIAVDQLLNALLFGFPDETLSSRAFRCRHKKRWALAERVINAIFFWDREGSVRHCELSFLGEKHLPERYRNEVA